MGRYPPRQGVPFEFPSERPVGNVPVYVSPGPSKTVQIFNEFIVKKESTIDESEVYRTEVLLKNFYQMLIIVLKKMDLSVNVDPYEIYKDDEGYDYYFVA